MKFYYAWYCPFAQRAWMTLLHKGLECELIEVDPYDKTNWWMEISRNTAQVPVIEYFDEENDNKTTIVDSTHVVEFLEELKPTFNPILPNSPAVRAEQRYWVDHINKKIVPYFYRFLKAKNPGKYRDSSREHLLEGLKLLSSQIPNQSPYFSGDSIGIVDILLIPFSYRIDILLSHYRDFEPPKIGDDWQKYQTWYTRILQEPIFKATSTNHANYKQRLIEFYFPYSQGGGQNDVTHI